MSDENEVITEIVTEALETAHAAEEQAHETAEAIALAAMETHRGERIEALERRMDEWQEQMSETSQAIAALVIGQTEVSSQISTLLTLQQPQTPPLPSEADGLRENLEPDPIEEPVEVVIAEAPEPEAPAPAPPKKKHRRWI